ncbi:MAG: Mur ligase family protein [Patescibacteria group bacterium]|jgi:UDP-N-acetylmuramate: L-alanyl-gamma-D-glutamyl-meso-diaminopimelate ligase
MHIHIVGIAGTMTAPLAVSLKNQGHTVTGSDQEKVFPPVSTILQKAHININSTSIDNNIDLAIIGSSFKSFSKTRQEFEQVKQLNIPFVSATEYIAHNLCKNESILVAGTYGKTTITSLLTWILKNANFNPSFMFGGESLNDIPSLSFSNSSWSVTEADESINGLDSKAKFLYYPLKHLLVTSADWEHRESYKTKAENLSAFINLVKKVPKDGLIVLDAKGQNTLELSRFSKSKTVFYNSPQSGYFIKEVSKKANYNKIKLATPFTDLSLKTPIFGLFNYENILAAVTMALNLGIEPTALEKAIFEYRGIKRRLELLHTQNNIHFFDDFAQSPPRIKAVLESLSREFPSQNIFVYYEPHASFILDKNNLENFNQAFSPASRVIVGKINFSNKISKSNRTTGSLIEKNIGPKSEYLPLPNDVLNYFTNNLKPNDIFIHMSSGGLTGINTVNQIINYFRKNNVKIHS